LITVVLSYGDFELYYCSDDLGRLTVQVTCICFSFSNGQPFQNGVPASKTMGPLTSSRFSLSKRSSTRVRAKGNAVPIHKVCGFRLNSSRHYCMSQVRTWASASNEIIGHHDRVLTIVKVYKDSSLLTEGISKYRGLQYAPFESFALTLGWDVRGCLGRPEVSAARLPAMLRLNQYVQCVSGATGRLLTGAYHAHDLPSLDVLSYEMLHR
jgi:hypothetical protein